LGWLPQGQAGIFLADAQGYYAAENLDVKIVRDYGLLRTVNEIDQGAFEFGIGDTTAVLLNRSDSGKTRLIGMLGQNPAGVCWIEHRHQITQPSDLKGRTLGLAAGSACAESLTPRSRAALCNRQAFRV
jgi:NitT/TauT family transport system substrate-binding protein